MARRLCQYCTQPLGRWAKVLLVRTCPGCVYRMSMGTSPARPPSEDPPATGQRGRSGLPSELASPDG
jgi:hypothetical protein